MENPPEDVPRSAVNEDLPHGMERRLVLRLLSFWRGLQEGDRFPSFEAVDPAEIPGIWDHSFVLEVVGNESDPVFRVTGDAVDSHSGGSMVGRHVSNAPADTLISVAVGYFAEVLTKGVPISRGGEFTKPDGTTVLYRSILLPMSDDGETISGLFGAANCREVERE